MTVGEMIKMLEKLPKERNIFVEMIPAEREWNGDRKFYEICGLEGRLVGTGIVIKENNEIYKENE